ncbi:hypothetical protein SAMN05216565_101312 [Litchfieldia salsa]|uniref:Uncharacterized protein n=1 Tax=Litchfieldia salsa TaxID=930152 RepID=A0A1H0PGY8_9BACI|nr:hypothetical protein SAMN05216565_101312 [Litchfieldia salsa]
MYLLLIFLLSACSEETVTPPIEPNENTMIITFKNNANFDFYSIEMSVNSHTGGISNADGSSIEKGSSLTFEYIDQVDLDLEGNQSFEVVLVGKEPTRVPLEDFTIELEVNKKYSFEITGNSIEDAELKRVN